MRWLRFLVLLLLVPLAACAINAAPVSYPVQTKGPYALDTGDVVRISVYGEAELTKSYIVDDAGSVSVPLIGSVPVRGKTTQQAAAAITAKLAQGFIREPSVAVEIESYRPFFIQGAVATGGQFPYVYGMTVRAAISTAGGFTDSANRQYALLFRRQGTQMLRSRVDLDFPILPGDTIEVTER
ncbi:MAG: polysaccharide biosynthesis/export family protein [Devosia sp.]